MKKILQEVNIIRPFVIFLLVLMHSFAIFSGGGDGWPRPDGVEQINLYKWFSWFITGFRIETIAFIAGYVFSYQSNVLGRKYTIWGIIKKKFIRLIIPCWFFGIIYALCFTRTDPIMQNAAEVINGIGHLWFLTMLFWCFLLLVIIDRFQTGKKRWIIFLLLMIVSCAPIPTQLPLLGLRRVPHFIFYAYLGYLMFLYKDNAFTVLKNKPWLFLVLYAASVILSNAVLPQIRNQGNPLIIEVCIYGMLKITQLISAVSGIIFLYLIVIKFLKRKGEQYTVPSYINAANNMCYGVYVFHQFILICLYYYTSIPSMVNSYILPVLSFFVVLALSVLLTAVFTRFRLGRFLIG